MEHLGGKVKEIEGNSFSASLRHFRNQYEISLAVQKIP